MTSEDMHGSPASTPRGQEELEAAVLNALLVQAQTETFGEALRDQFAELRPIRRQLSGVGFFLDLEVSRRAQRLSGTTSPLSLDVCADVAGVGPTAGFILFTDEAGYVDMLEGYTYGDDAWPEDVSNFKLVNSLGEPCAQ